jgi:hypothetical protein
VFYRDAADYFKASHVSQKAEGVDQVLVLSLGLVFFLYDVLVPR